MLGVVTRTGNLPAPPHVVFDDLTVPDRSPSRPWLFLLDDEVAPRHLVGRPRLPAVVGLHRAPYGDRQTTEGDGFSGESVTFRRLDRRHSMQDTQPSTSVPSSAIWRRRM